MPLFIVNMLCFISLFPQRPLSTVYRIVTRILFCSLEFKTRQYPDIRVGRQETGRKKKKTHTTTHNGTLLEISVGVGGVKNFLLTTLVAGINFLEKED